MNQQLISQINTLIAQNQRVVLALAGAPASGKSTLAEDIHAHYEDSVILPMDGFHLDNQVLDKKNIRSVKGAPQTFDVDGFISSIKRVYNNENIFVPAFDRELDVSRAGAIEITNQKLIIVEGNYLLFNQSPWNTLTNYWTLSIWLDVPIEEIETRCINRWLKYGFCLEDAKKRARGNDVKNAITVNDNRLDADFVLRHH